MFHSVFSYYKELIRLRHENEIIVYGDYELLEPDSEELFIYTRTLGDEKWIVMCNFTEHDATIPADILSMISEDAPIMISNYVENMPAVLRPYEATVRRI